MIIELFLFEVGFCFEYMYIMNTCQYQNVIEKQLLCICFLPELVLALNKAVAALLFRS